MADATDWKAKHLASLREMELEERRWRDLEQVLRRLVNRLCAAAIGVDPRLDAQLSKLAEANRRGAALEELSARHESLSDALKSLELVPGGRVIPDFTATLPVARPSSAAALAAAPAGGPATRAATRKLLDRLAASDPRDPRLPELSAQLAAAVTDAALAEVLAGLADLLAERGNEIARERSAAAAVLAQVTERLEEMATYLGAVDEQSDERLKDADSLNTTVLSQVANLSQDARAAADLASLRVLVAERLEVVAGQVREFRSREGQRAAEHSARAESLRARIVELERETRELNRNLDQERRRSRQDALTRLANRAAFDERLAEELPRWQRFRTPVSLLLWDVDRFKAINDAYGHRVGDAVLREVAACLASRARRTDVVARYGGEEFGMLLVGTNSAAAASLAEELRAAVAALGFHYKGEPVAVTVSCGLTEFRDRDTRATVFDRADAALYRAKDGGRNRCVVA